MANLNLLAQSMKRHGVTATLPDGSTVDGFKEALRDTPRADFNPEDDVNTEATPRHAFRSLTPLPMNKKVTILGVAYYVEMVTPEDWDHQTMIYASVLLQRV